VELVMVDGEIVMQDRRVLKIDQPRLLREAQETAVKLVARLG